MVDYKFYRLITEGTLDDYIIYDSTLNGNCYNNNSKFLEKLRKNHNLPSRKVLHYYYEDNYLLLDDSPWIIKGNDVLLRSSKENSYKYISCEVLEIENKDEIENNEITLEELPSLSPDSLFYNDKNRSDKYDILNEYCYEISKLNISTIPHLYGPPDPLDRIEYENKDSDSILQYIISFNEASNNICDELYVSGRRARNKKKNLSGDDIYTYPSSDEETLPSIPKITKLHNNLLPVLPSSNNVNIWTKTCDSLLLWIVKEYGENWELVSELLVKYKINKGSLNCKNRYEKLNNQINNVLLKTSYNNDLTSYSSDNINTYSKDMNNLLCTSSNLILDNNNNQVNKLIDKSKRNTMNKVINENITETKYDEIINDFDSILRINNNESYDNSLQGNDRINVNINNSNSNNNNNTNERIITPSVFLDDYYSKKKENQSNVTNPPINNAININNNNGIYYNNMMSNSNAIPYDNIKSVNNMRRNTMVFQNRNTHHLQNITPKPNNNRNIIQNNINNTMNNGINMQMNRKIPNIKRSNKTNRNMIMNNSIVQNNNSIYNYNLEISLNTPNPIQLNNMNNMSNMSHYVVPQTVIQPINITTPPIQSQINNVNSTQPPINNINDNNFNDEIHEAISRIANRTDISDEEKKREVALILQQADSRRQ